MKKIIIIITVILLCGCSSTKSDKILSSNDKGKEQLTIYRKSDDKDIETTLNLFKKKNTKVKINDVVIDGYLEYKEKLVNDLMVGEGPDIIVFNSSTFNSTYKTMKSGIFEDLQPYIDKKVLDIEDLKEEVCNSGLTNGKRFFIPMNYGIPIILSVESRLEKYQIDFDNLTWENVLDEASKINAENNNTFLGDFDLNNFFIQAAECSNYKYIDYDKKEAYFDTQEFIDLLKYYKELIKISLDKTSSSYCDLVENGRLCLYNQSSLQSSFRNISAFNQECKVNLNSDMRIKSYNTIEGKCEYTAFPIKYLAINTNSKNKQLAIEFIKTALSHDVQTKLHIGIPINNVAQTKIIEQVKKDYNISKTLIDDWNSIINNIKTSVVSDAYIQDLIYKAMSSILNKNITEEKAAETLQKKAILYLNE